MTPVAGAKSHERFAALHASPLECYITAGMHVFVVHGAIIAAFLAAGVAQPRTRSRLSDTLLNLTTGATLALGRMILLSGWVGSHAGAIRLDVHGAAAQCLAAFLIADFARYWLHYAHHRVDALWRFHRVHHSSETLDASSGLRMHAVDFAQLTLLPICLFGGLFNVSGFDPRVWPALVVITDLFDAMQHANIALALDRPLARAWDRLFNNPVFHSWHHSVNPGEHNGNYGQALTIWDRVFGTHIDRVHAATEFGLPEGERLEASWWGLQALRPPVRN